MRDFLASLAQRRENQTASVLLYEVEQAFSEVPAESPTRTMPRAQELYELVRFVNLESISEWLESERNALHRVLAFARKIEADELAGILEAALDGRPQPPITFSIRMPDEQPVTLDLENESVWDDTDCAISLALERYEEALLDALIDAAPEFDLLAPQEMRDRAAMDLVIQQHAATHTVGGLFKTLVSAVNPRIEAGSSSDADEEDRITGMFPVIHVCGPPAEPKLLRQLAERYGPVIGNLCEVYRQSDGAELFQCHGETGFSLARICEWDALLEQAIEWAEGVTWQDAHEEIPDYLYSAIAFGYIPGDSERWLLITQGKYAGCVMLSDTDLIDERPRYRSFAEFIAALVMDPVRILGNGGYVRYEYGDVDLFPIRYLHD